MRKKFSKGFGFAIDYDKEIAADERLIAQLDEVIAKRWFKPETMIVEGNKMDIKSYAIHMKDLIFMDARVREQLNIDLNELADLACHFDRETPIPQLDGTQLDLPSPPVGAYLRGRKLCDSDKLRCFDVGYLRSEAECISDRKHAKAALARHRRNKDRYGATPKTASR